MTDTIQNTNGLPWWMSPAQMTEAFLSFGRSLPSGFSQPILPGWSFGNITVTEQNSSAPDTERQIVARDSYGRQLGRMMDAVCALIDERPAGAAKAKAYDDLIALKERIDEVKKDAALHRVQQLRSDLALLKTKDPDEYRRVTKELKAALGDTGS